MSKIDIILIIEDLLNLSQQAYNEEIEDQVEYSFKLDKIIDKLAYLSDINIETDVRI